MTNSICDACETVAHCKKNGCIPIQPEHLAVNKHIVVQANGRNKLIDLVIYFDGDKVVNITWEQ